MFGLVYDATCQHKEEEITSIKGPQKKSQIYITSMDTRAKHGLEFRHPQ